MTDRLARAIWLLVGWLALGAAAAGAVLPLVPTTPFLLVAAWAFARSSRRLHSWLVGHRLFGPLIRDWQRNGSIPRRAKRLALAMMAAVFLLSLAAGVATWLLVVQALVLSACAAFILSRPDGSAGG